MATRERGAMEIKAMEEGEEDSRVKVRVWEATSRTGGKENQVDKMKGD